MADVTTEQLLRYLGRRFPDWQGVEVGGLHRLPMGASRETYRFDLTWREGGGAPQTMGLILRRDPPASHVKADRRTEYESYRAVHGRGLPVPKMILLEEDPAALDGSFSLAEDLRGFHNSEYQLQEPQWRDRLPGIAEQCWTYMGRLAALDAGELGLKAFLPAATRETTARAQLDHWLTLYRADNRHPDPAIEAAIRQLLRWQPVAQKLAMVHGDFRAGNFLYDDAGIIRAILDWEMAHIGDPLEDLAWSLNRAFCFGKDDRAGGLAPRADAIAIWERASGLEAEPKALRWWELFTNLKCQALWESAAATWESGKNASVILAYAPWWLMNVQRRAVLELVGRL